MTWAQRLKRVFNIDMPQGTLSWRFAPIHLVEVCGRCGGSVKVIVDASNRCIEDQDVIDRILAHLRKTEQDIPALPLLAPPSRGPPETLPLFAWKGVR